MKIGVYFVLLLFFIGMRMYMKSWIIAGGAVMVAWSVLAFFSDTANEKRAAVKHVDEYNEERNLFKNGDDEDF
jgi:protein-S-isoprenylcysteine O-methyltransferase Ste14